MPQPTPRDARQPGDGQRQIDGEQRHIGLDRADQRRRGEPAGEPEQRARRSEAQRQPQRRRGDRGERSESEERPDELVDVRRDQDRRIQRRDPRPRQRLRHAHVAQLRLVAPRQFGAADQAEAEQQAGHDLHSGREDASEKAQVDRIFDDQHPGDGERDAARPDRQRLAEQILEARRGAARRLRRRCGRLGLRYRGSRQGELCLRYRRGGRASLRRSAPRRRFAQRRRGRRRGHGGRLHHGWGRRRFSLLRRQQARMALQGADPFCSLQQRRLGAFQPGPRIHQQDEHDHDRGEREKFGHANPLRCSAC